ncbi:MAG TPA: hypothetical protein VH206_14355 [Xanthobacteraceae bacterium]|jgi:hypothetical protein|nr:hypothetical protein [Xanthobacteraceae bacterium]
MDYDYSEEQAQLFSWEIDKAIIAIECTVEPWEVTTALINCAARRHCARSPDAARAKGGSRVLAAYLIATVFELAKQWKFEPRPATAVSDKSPDTPGRRLPS